MKLIVSSSEMRRHAATLRRIADRFEQAGKAKLDRKVKRTKALRSDAMLQAAPLARR